VSQPAHMVCRLRSATMRQVLRWQLQAWSMKGVPASQSVIAMTGPHHKVSLSITKPCVTDHKIVLLTQRFMMKWLQQWRPAIFRQLRSAHRKMEMLGRWHLIWRLGVPMPMAGMMPVCKCKRTNFLLSYLRFLYNFRFRFLFHVYHIHHIFMHVELSL